jgi:hypothetical protein
VLLKWSNPFFIRMKELPHTRVSTNNIIHGVIDDLWFATKKNN